MTGRLDNKTRNIISSKIYDKRCKNHQNNIISKLHNWHIEKKQGLRCELVETLSEHRWLAVGWCMNCHWLLLSSDW